METLYVWGAVSTPSDKYILQFGQINFAIWTNTFGNLDKYILSTGEICYRWVRGRGIGERLLPSTPSDKYIYHADKHILLFEQIHFFNRTNICWSREEDIFSAWVVMGGLPTLSPPLPSSAAYVTTARKTFITFGEHLLHLFWRRKHIQFNLTMYIFTLKFCCLQVSFCNILSDLFGISEHNLTKKFMPPTEIHCSVLFLHPMIPSWGQLGSTPSTRSSRASLTLKFLRHEIEKRLRAV